MGKKIALNVFYNLGVVLSIFGAVWGYNNKNYIAILAFVVLMGLFLYLKIQLMKTVRNTLKK